MTVIHLHYAVIDQRQLVQDLTDSLDIDGFVELIMDIEEHVAELDFTVKLRNELVTRLDEIIQRESNR